MDRTFMRFSFSLLVLVSQMMMKQLDILEGK